MSVQIEEQGKAESTGTPPTRRLHLVGVEFSPAPSLMQTEALVSHLRQAWDGQKFIARRIPEMEPIARPIFMDDEGVQHVLSTERGSPTLALPWSPAQAADLSVASSTGGFVPFSAFPSRPPPPTDTQLSFALFRQALIRGAMERQRSAKPQGSGAMSFFQSASPGVGQSPQGASSVGASGAAGGSHPLQMIGQALNYAPELLGLLFGGEGGGGNLPADPMHGGVISEQSTSILSGMGGKAIDAGIGQLLGAAGQALMSKLFPLDDSSSLGAQVAAKAVGELMGELQAAATAIASDLAKQAIDGMGLGDFGVQGMDSVTGGLEQGIKDRISKYTQALIPGFPSATASHLAVRMGDVDSKGDRVLSGFPTVLVEGQPIAREGDPVDKIGVMIYQGSGTVSAGGLKVARDDSSSAVGPKFTKTALLTYVGGPLTGALPPSPTAEKKSPPKVNQAKTPPKQAPAPNKPNAPAKKGSTDSEHPEKNGEEEDNTLRDAITDGADGVKDGSKEGHAMTENEKALEADKEASKQYEEQKSAATDKLNKSQDDLKTAEGEYESAKNKATEAQGGGDSAEETGAKIKAGEDLENAKYKLEQSQSRVLALESELEGMRTAPATTATFGERVGAGLKTAGKVVGVVGQVADAGMTGVEIAHAVHDGHAEQAVPLLSGWAFGMEGAELGGSAGLAACGMFNLAGLPGAAVDLVCGAGGAVVGGFGFRQFGKAVGEGVIDSDRGNPEAFYQMIQYGPDHIA